MTDGYAYYRISTTRQEAGASLGTQQDAVRRYAHEHGVTLREELTDIQSGTRDDRPAYQRLLTLLMPGDVAFVWRLDRVGRNKAELFRFFDHCKKNHIALISVTQPDLSNELVRDIMSVLAAYESQQLAERILPNMLARASEGRWMGRTPRWTQIGPDGHLSPTEDASDAQRAFDAFLATRNVEATAVMFGADTGSMRQWLRNRAYIGEATWRGVTVEHAHPAIVKRETFDAVNAILDARRRTGRREPSGAQLLTGFIYVMGTERRMYFHRDKRTQCRWYTTQANHGALPRYSVSADLAETYAVEQLMTLTLTPAERKDVERQVRERARHDPDKRLRNSLSKKRAALVQEQLSTDRMRARGEIDAPRWERMQQEQRRELAGIDAQLALLSPLPDLRSIAPVLDLRVRLDADIARAWEARNIPALRALVEAFVERIEVDVEPTEGKRGGAWAYWLAHPAVFSVVWTDAVLLNDSDA